MGGGWALADDALVSRVHRTDEARQVIGAAIEVHRHLGPGLLESAYEPCLAWELAARGLSFRRQVAVPVIYKGVRIPGAYKVDFLVEERLLLELKATDHLLPIHHAQVITYLRLLDLRQALLIYFNVPRLVEGLKSLVNGWSATDDDSRRHAGAS